METLRFLMVSTHFSPFSLGGDAIHVEYLSRELVRNGHEVHVLHSPDAYRLLRKDPIANARESPNDGVIRHLHGSALGRAEPLLALTTGYSAKAARKLRELTNDLKPEVIHWHNTRGFLGRPEASPSVLSLYTAHDYYLVCPRSNLLRPSVRLCKRPELCQLCVLRWRKPPQLWRAGRRRVVGIPSDFKVISPSNFLANRLKQDGIAVDHVLGNFAPRPQQGGGRRPSERDTILFLGLLEAHKGPRTLLEGFARSYDKQGFNLMIVGEGSLKARLRERTRVLGVEKRVEIPGYLSKPDLQGVLNRTASLAIPSEWYENCPLVVLEAFSNGIPVMGSEIGGLPELLTPEAGSLTFRSGDPDSIAKSMIETWDERQNLEERSKKARDEYERRFSPEAFMAKYMSIIRGGYRAEPGNRLRFT